MKRNNYGKAKVIALLAVTYAFAKFQGGFASWFLFYSTFTFFGYGVLAYALMFAGLQVTREIDRDRLQDGEDVVVCLRLRRKVWFPLGWNLVTESLPDKLAGFYEPHRQLVFPWFRREIVIRYVIPAVPRGFYQLGECTVSAGDFFGFIQRTKTFPLLNEFLVYPSYRKLSDWQTGDGRISGNIHVSHRSSDDVAAVRGVRDYQRGDRLSQIHWRASARGQGLKTKEFEHQAMNQMVFFLDVEKRAYQQKDPQLFELAVKWTASLVYDASRRQHPFGFVCKQKDRIVIPPGNTQAHFFRVFDQLARVTPDGEYPFAQLLGREAMEFLQGSTLVVITSALDKPLLRQMLELAGSGRNVHFFWIHQRQTLTDEERQALRLLAAGRVACRTVLPEEYDERRRIGGA